MKKKVRILFEITLVAMLIIKIFCVDFAKVSGDSMEANFSNGDIVIVNKTQNSYARNDVVLSYYRIGIFKKNIIKRVIGLPSEKIQIKNGKVYINDEVLNDDINIYIEYAGIASDPIILNDNEYFVLGDNRNESKDSRDEQIGIISSNKIIGVVEKIVHEE